ncbi:MAG: radical SAM protein [Deltaproteobacteria bacterium]|nr:radical SAM protein [Deltaproteobacteria bacterium]
MAGEVGALFDDEALGQTLAAELDDRDVIAVSDYDGTLFHKHDSDRTRRSVAAFRRFPARIVCSARPVADLVAALDDHGLEADWIVGCSGGVVADGRGRVLWSTPLDPRDIAALEAHLPTSKRIHCGNEVVQLSADADSLPPLPGYRVETYQGTAFISRWEASKLRAVHRLLRHLDWRGRVRAFGDGPYDEELLAYFDGTLIRGASSPVHLVRPRRSSMHEGFFKGYWMVTNRCNLDCGYCVLEDAPDQLRRELDLAGKKALAAHLYHRLGFRRLTLSGGEVLMIGRKPPADFVELLRFLKSFRSPDPQQNLELEIYTNGVLLDDAVADEMAGVVDQVAVTIDSADDRLLTVLGRNHGRSRPTSTARSKCAPGSPGAASR